MTDQAHDPFGPDELAKAEAWAAEFYRPADNLGALANELLRMNFSRDDEDGRVTSRASLEAAAEIAREWKLPPLPAPPQWRRAVREAFDFLTNNYCCEHRRYFGSLCDLDAARSLPCAADWHVIIPIEQIVALVRLLAFGPDRNEESEATAERSA